MSPEETARLFFLFQIAGFVTIVAGGIVLLILMAGAA